MRAVTNPHKRVTVGRPCRALARDLGPSALQSRICATAPPLTPLRYQAVTVYSLYSADMETIHLGLRATFRNVIRLPLSPFSEAPCDTFEDVGYRGEFGEVELEVVRHPVIGPRQ